MLPEVHVILGKKGVREKRRQFGMFLQGVLWSQYALLFLNTISWHHLSPSYISNTVKCKVLSLKSQAELKQTTLLFF